jgi:hypothetical protein
MKRNLEYTLQTRYNQNQQFTHARIPLLRALHDCSGEGIGRRSNLLRVGQRRGGASATRWVLDHQHSTTRATGTDWGRARPRDRDP